MKVDDLSYLAGIIDGEGSVGFHSAGRNRLRFVMEVKMTSEHIIDWLVEHFGGVKAFRPSSNPKWKDQWRWRVQNDEAKRLYLRVQPLLKIKSTI